MSPVLTTRDPDVTYLLARALPDTVRVGAGAVRLTGDPGDPGGARTGDRPIFGQLIEVDPFGGADSVRMTGAFAATGAQRAIVVPWDYDSMCRTIRRRGSASFVAPGGAGAYTLRLRAPEHWADGMPTFDVYIALFQPYPLASYFARGSAGTYVTGIGERTSEDALTAAEYFDFYRALPDRRSVRAQPELAVTWARQWAERHPDLAAKFPAAEILRLIRRDPS